MNPQHFYDSVVNRKSFIWSPDYLDLTAPAWIEHIPFAYWLVETMRPRSIVELGVHKANSFFSFCQAVKLLDLPTVTYGVDTWMGDEHAGFYTDDVYQAVAVYKENNYSNFATLIRSTFDEAVHYFQDGSVDLLHIDGLHTYEAVRHDFETWLPKLSPDAIVLFHDINVKERDFGVFRFWEELTTKYSTIHFDFGSGLGVLCMGTPAVPELNSLFTTGHESRDFRFLANLFAERGTAFILRRRTAMTDQHVTNLESMIHASAAQRKADEESAEARLLALQSEANTQKLALEEQLRKADQLLVEQQESAEKITTELQTELQVLQMRIDELQQSLAGIVEQQKLSASELQVARDKIAQLESGKQTLLRANEGLQIKLDRSLANVMQSEKDSQKLKAEHHLLQESVAWFRRTYEERSMLGVIRQKLFARRVKKPFAPKPIADAQLIALEKKGIRRYKAGHDLTLGADNIYSCNGTDPQFIIETGDRGLRAGWYYLTIEFKDVTGITSGSKLYLDTGAGYNEEETRLLPAPSNGKIERLVHFDKRLSALRFDPGAGKSTFTMGEFRLRRLSKQKAFRFALMKYRQNNHPDSSYFSVFFGLAKDYARKGGTALQKKLRDSLYSLEGNSDEYLQWVELYDTLSGKDLEKIRSLADHLPVKPVFSVVMPVYNAPVQYLVKAIESVRSQVYSRWELCIGEDCSTDPAIEKVLREYEQKDARIKVNYRNQNGHISLASNSALEFATGDYIALLDQDDELTPHALYLVAKEINKYPDAAIIYSDEDKIDEGGNRFNPYFKTDWNRDLFYGQNMINHLGVYKASLVKAVGGFRVGYEGSQDYDLILRCIEKIDDAQIRHIPHVLYHWRAISGSTALTMSSKSYAVDAGIKALNEHFVRMSLPAHAVCQHDHRYRVLWQIPDKPPKVSVIIPTRDKLEVLRVCVSSLLDKTKYPDLEILIIDNRSEEKATLDYFETIRRTSPSVKVLAYDAEFNFSAMNNYGVQHASGTVLCLLNNDTEVINAEWLNEMVSHCMRTGIGAVGAKLYYPTGEVQHAGVVLYPDQPGNHIYLRKPASDAGYFNKLTLVQNYLAVTGACLVVRKDVYLQAGGLDEVNLKVAYNDVDFCLKVHQLGYRNVWTPFAELVHHESLSRGNAESELKSERFWSENKFMVKKWKPLLEHDPYFNPNLGLDTFKGGPVFPPRIVYEWQDAVVLAGQKEE